jgi:hypothetical protein
VWFLRLLLFGFNWIIINTPAEAAGEGGAG